jgi:hypothetical protein
MRIMARQTRQRAAAFLEALAFLEIRRLVTHVPRIIPIYRSPIPVRETMTRSTQSIQFSCRKSFRVLDQLARLLGQVLSGRQVVEQVGARLPLAGLGAAAARQLQAGKAEPTIAPVPPELPEVLSIPWFSVP